LGLQDGQRKVHFGLPATCLQRRKVSFTASPRGRLTLQSTRKRLRRHLLSLIEDEDGLVETMLTPSRLIFQQDNAPIHNSIRTRRFLERSNIAPMQWPANSPDLNPIETICFLMKKAFHSKWVAARREKSRNLTTQELENLLLDRWKSIDSDQLLRLVWSMPRRVVAVIKLEVVSLNI